MNIIKRHLSQSTYSKRSLDPDCIVIHAISARNIDSSKPYDTDLIIGIFEKYRVSAHYMISRNGDILELVPETNRAYHAGKSQLRDKVSLNNHAIGIEFVGMDDEDFEDGQYTAGAQLVRNIIERHNIDTNSIKMHSEVSGPKIRKNPKWDAGIHFDWMYFGALVGRI